MHCAPRCPGIPSPAKLSPGRNTRAEAFCFQALAEGQKPRSAAATHARRARRIAASCRSGCFAKKQRAHRVLRPVGHSLLMMVQTIVVLWVCWTACIIHAVPHVAARERFAALHVAPDDPCAAPHVAPHDRRAAQRAVLRSIPDIAGAAGAGAAGAGAAGCA